MTIDTDEVLNFYMALYNYYGPYGAFSSHAVLHNTRLSQLAPARSEHYLDLLFTDNFRVNYIDEDSELDCYFTMRPAGYRDGKRHRLWRIRST